MANRQSLAFSERGQISQAIPQLHGERMLHERTPIVRSMNRGTTNAGSMRRVCFGGRYNRQRTLVIRIAAITLASDSTITIARFCPCKRPPPCRHCTSHPHAESPSLPYYPLKRCPTLRAIKSLLFGDIFSFPPARRRAGLCLNTTTSQASKRGRLEWDGQKFGTVCRHDILSERIKHALNWGPPFRVTFCPQFPGGGKQWIHTRDPVEIVYDFPQKGVGRGGRVKGGEGGWKGGRRRHKMVITIWCGLDSPWFYVVLWRFLTCYEDGASPNRGSRMGALKWGPKSTLQLVHNRLQLCTCVAFPALW